ncbi:inositol monophosphatase [Planctomonas sp. JC2975]|uniref:inositol monophosphatase family protein n=1 Tax=Planctomonas sp. JC2975 TaxID=2729626 RepID=UPI001473BB87|nr:inositol monophosphatase family protein [Planctomonas sp. JC2975]NNC13426.1 inositol monophosphatase [Planctomonas sp. JC2975]
MTVATAELLDLARTIALEAGELVRSRREQGVEVAATKTAPEDIVTAADRESEDLIRGRLADARPGDGFFGEESDASVSSTGLTWIVDPIDGTVNYLYGIPAYAVSIAAVEGDPDPNTWRALASAVVNPASGEVYTASVGGGAFLGTSRLQVATGKQLSLALVGTGFSYDSRRRGLQAEAVSMLIPRVRDIRRIGSAALDLCSVASGRLDAYYEKGLKPWDHAGGALVASEAGATVAGLHGAAASRALTIAAEPGLFAQLEPILDEIGVADR